MAQIQNLAALGMQVPIHPRDIFISTVEALRQIGKMRAQRCMNYLLFPTLLLALGLFGSGVWLSPRVGKGMVYRSWLVIGAAMAIPGVVFAAYYLKIFAEPATTIPFFR